MRRNFLLSLLVGCLAFALTHEGMSSKAGLVWQSGYKEQDILKPEVLGFWSFDGSEPLRDRSGNGHDLNLRGQDTRVVAEGKFGGALEVGVENQPGDSRQGAAVANSPNLSPHGAFSIEMWIQPSEALANLPIAYLVDKKYLPGTNASPKGNRDYMLLLRRSKTGEFRLEADLGFGEDSKVIRSQAFVLNAGEWRHVAMTYDGQGRVVLYLDGIVIGEQVWEGKGPVVAGKLPLIIGDRYGSTGFRFAGRISQVRLTAEAVAFRPVPKVVLELQQPRSNFYRMEQDATLRVLLTNHTSDTLRGLRAKLVGFPREWSIQLPEIPVDGSLELDIPVDTQLRPGAYEGRLELMQESGDAEFEGGVLPLTYSIHARLNPQRMPIIMWGNTGNLQALSDIGFTHSFIVWQGSTSHWVNFLRPQTVANLRARLDELLAWKLSGLAQISAGRNPPAEYSRVDADGKRYPKAVNPLFPEVQQAAFDLGASVAQNFRDMPALQGMLLNTEVRDHTRISFHEVDQQAWRAHSGKDLPLAVNNRTRGIAYQQIADFPSRRIIPDDHEILEFYRWFWKEGDGWNRFHTKIHEGLKTANRPDWWTWNDPAVRVPSVYGSGGEVDYLSQWTYTYPDPLKIALAGEELMAMSRPNPKQGFMNMTQIIWYRTQTAPMPKEGVREDAAEWEKDQPDARFITIAPDHLSEALWLKLSQPVQGIMYHGWGSLIDAREGGYRGTNPETRARLSELIRTVVEPLGPTLRQVPEGKREVAFLESFTSQMFAGRGSYGWGRGWGADSYIIARYAGLQPKVIYEETILDEGLGDYQVLFLTHCDVLTEKVTEKILHFQERGGIVIADEFLAPGIQPDILLTSFRRDHIADEDRAKLLHKAQELKDELNPYYRFSVRSTNPEILVGLRDLEGADYLFVINDHRTYGDYVGHHKLVMEKGLPASGKIRITGRNKVVYDLLSHSRVETTESHGSTQFQADLEPGGGRVYLVLDKEIGALQVRGAEQVKRGESYELETVLKDQDGQPLSAVVPLQIKVYDASGELAEGTGYYGAPDGSLKLVLDIAPNDPVGKWSAEVVEGVSGQRVIHNFLVQ